ncbi:steroid receptor RNA activator 1-like [Brachionichthys hirsutus]|uniref:steroid receptor RNA activator 1-like n=1 Tax=Brachionichthys hirsutus TaxID=412623 RepID=UPI0036048323
MEDVYVKPGNQERGWNDPPQLSYGLQMAHGPPKSLLHKRVAPPEASGVGAPPVAPPISSPLAPPPLRPARLPSACAATPPPPSGPMRHCEAEGSQSACEPDAERALLLLNAALAACRRVVKDQVCNDVEKRLRLLEDSWRSGRLSLPVRRRMDTLSSELQAGRWDSADEVHRSLMVDHVTEVSQWMVGVKRLIAETRKLSPELLEPLQEAARSSVDPAQAAAGPDQDSTASVQESADPLCAAPVHDPEEPVQARPDPDPAQPIQDPVSQS